MYWGLPEGDRRSVRTSNDNQMLVLAIKYGNDFNCNPYNGGSYAYELKHTTTSEVQEIVEGLLESYVLTPAGREAHKSGKQ